MTNTDVIYQRRVAAIAHATEIGNVSEAARIFGVARQTLSEWISTAKRYGMSALMPKGRRRPQQPNENLREEPRENFFLGVLGILNEHDGEVVVVIVDMDTAAATGADTPQEDATRLFLERASNRFHAARMDGMVLIDRPSGDRADENRFLAECIDHLRDDDTYAVEERFALPVLATQSRFVRLLQAADLISSCSVACVSGEPQYSPPIFDAIRPMLASELGRKGGVGMKIHPDYRCANLYQWLLGDTDLWRGNMGTPLPLAGRRYATGDGIPDPD